MAGVDRVGVDAMTRLGNAFDTHQAGRNEHRIVDGKRESDALRTDSNRNIDSNHLAVDIQQRPARIAGVNARTCLDQVLILLSLADLYGSIDRADDAFRDRVGVAIGVSDCNHGLAAEQIVRRSNRDRSQRPGHVNFDDGQVARRVVGDQTPNHGGLVV